MIMECFRQYVSGDTLGSQRGPAPVPEPGRLQASMARKPYENRRKDLTDRSGLRRGAARTAGSSRLFPLGPAGSGHSV